MEKENPILSSMRFAEGAYFMLGKVNQVLTCAIVTGLCVTGIVTIYVARAFTPVYTLPSIVRVPLALIVFAILAPLTIYYGFTAKAMLKDWAQKFAAFSFAVRFETVPLSDKTPQKDLINHVAESIPEIGTPLRGFLAENPSALDDFMNVRVRGEDAEETLDVCIRKEQVKDMGTTAHRLRKALNRYGIVLVKQIDKEDPVDENDLSAIRSHVLQTLKVGRALPFARTKINRMLMVSTSFDESARLFVADRKNWIGGKSFSLVEKHPKGYIVVSAVT